MTRRSIEEYADAVRGRYFRASKKKKTEILDEFVANTGLHRKATIRLLNRRKILPGRKRRGRPKLYDLEVMAALKVGWEATDRICSKRLQPFLPELVGILKTKGEITVTEETEEKLGRMSASTIDRILRRWRRKEPRHGISTTKPGTLLKNAIPVRTFSEWDEKKPGFIEADLVAHCGDSVEGFYLTTLSTVDVATGWCEPVAVWGKGHDRVGGAVHHVRERLPMPMLGLDSDNGSEFINRGLYDYCRRWHITFTRSRSYKKNDSCYVEQKNWAVVRQVIGYDRFSSKAAFKALEDVYTLLRLYVNFFQPVLKLMGKEQIDGRTVKRYDQATTPFRRVLASNDVSIEVKARLTGLYFQLNPVTLRNKIDDNVAKLWKLVR